MSRTCELVPEEHSIFTMSKPIENANGIQVEKAQAQMREREGSESETIVHDGSGTVKHSSGMTVDTHYAAQIRPSKLTGRGLTFMVRLLLLYSQMEKNVSYN